MLNTTNTVEERKEESCGILLNYIYLSFHQTPEQMTGPRMVNTFYTILNIVIKQNKLPKDVNICHNDSEVSQTTTVQFYCYNISKSLYIDLLLYIYIYINIDLCTTLPHSALFVSRAACVCVCVQSDIS